MMSEREEAKKLFDEPSAGIMPVEGFFLFISFELVIRCICKKKEAIKIWQRTVKIFALVVFVIVQIFYSPRS